MGMLIFLLTPTNAGKLNILEILNKVGNVSQHPTILLHMSILKIDMQIFF